MVLKVLAIALVIAVFVVALLPGGVALPGNPGDTIQHSVAFVALTFAFRMAWPGVAWIHHFSLMVALGGAIELVQLVPALHRDPGIGDWLVDVAAILVTLAGLVLWGACRAILADGCMDYRGRAERVLQRWWLNRSPWLLAITALPGRRRREEASDQQIGEAPKARHAGRTI